jgi:hypothetical protein
VTSGETSQPQRRETAKGHTSAPTNDAHDLWANRELANAHTWAETVVSGSEFPVERYGTQRNHDDPAASVRMTVRVNAADASGAERTVRLLLDEAMPTGAFDQVVAEAITGRYVAGSHSEPVCSFCGWAQRQVKKLIAGPGVYICNDCAEAAAEMLQEDAQPPRSDD